MSWLKDIGTTGIVVDYSNREYLERHHHFEVTFAPLLLDCLLELGYAIVVFVGQLPPVRA